MSARKAPKPLKNQYLQVFVRCRPMNGSEISQRTPSLIEINGHKEISIQDRVNSKVSKTYSFDRVFGPQSSQADVFQHVVDPLISDVLSGYNCTVFAYGQTGSGKTFTMEGNTEPHQIFTRESTAGLIPRAMCALFDELRVLQAEYTVRVSLMELYNEELYDLLSPDEVPPKLRLYDDAGKKGSVIVQGLQEVMVHTQSQVLAELHKGSAKRKVAATLMNAHSSRSHTIFCVTVHSKENSVDGEELLKTGKLYLVDLAGSENIGRSGSVDKRAREAASINQSLLTLSRVTSCLVEHQPHVPYRESKLTRLLQDSLGGRTKTSLIATISPSHLNIDETLSTLDYALRAKSVANKPEVNQKVSQNVVMKEYMDVIEDLKKKLDLHRNGAGVYVNDENYKEMVEQTQERNKKIYDVISQIRSLHHSKKTLEETFQAMTEKREKYQRNTVKLINSIEKMEEVAVAASQDLDNFTAKQHESKSLLEKVSEKEKELLNQAKDLSNIAKSAQSDIERIHDRLDFSKVVLVENKMVLKKLKEKSSFYQAAVTKTKDALCAGSRLLVNFVAATDAYSADTQKDLDILLQHIREVLKKCLIAIKESDVLFEAVVHRRKAMAQKAVEDNSALLCQELKDFESIQKILYNAYSDFSRLLSNFPQEPINSMVELIKNTAENMTRNIQVQMNMNKDKLNNIDSESTKHVGAVVKSLHNLLIEEEKKTARKNMELLGKTTAEIKVALMAGIEQIGAHKLQMLDLRENRKKCVSDIRLMTTASVEYLKQQQSEVSRQSTVVHEALISCESSLVDGLKEKFSGMREIITEASRVTNKAGEDVKHHLSRDSKTPHLLLRESCKNTSYQTNNDLNTAIASVNDIAQELGQVCKTFPPSYACVMEKRNNFEMEADESLGMFIDGVLSTTPECLKELESGKSTVNEVLSTEFKHDPPTGETPIKKSYGPIPQPDPLPSPVAQKARSNIQQALWKTLLQSPRKPLHSSINLSDEGDSGMSSDSELSLHVKRSEFSGLHKTSSLCDLRSNSKSIPVFHRPRQPKKYVRKSPL